MMDLDHTNRVLAKHYGLTDLPAPRLRQAVEELDCIINYGIKYRMGGALDAD